MRGTIIQILGFLAVPLAFLSPFLGLLAYCWLSYMRPMDMAWGIGHITFGMYTAVAIFAGLLVRLRLQFFRWSPITWILFAYWAWWGVCTYTAYDRAVAMEGLVQISRVFVICLVTTGLCVTKDRLRWVLVATAGSLLFHGTKLGILGIATGGSRNVNPIGGLMSGNNENAIALNMALPFAVHFALNETKKWRRWALWAVAGLTVVAIVCTYSRGGFLGMAAAGAVLLWHSRARWFGLFVVAPALLVVGFLAAPEEWKSRIGGIDEARHTDQSAQFRLMAWSVAADITMAHPVVGIGPENFYSQAKKFPRPSTMHDMEIHNTYLELSSSLGLTGLAGYFVLVGTVWWTVSRVRKDARVREDPRLRWFDTAATATQASILSFLVSSTFGSLANFELMYHVCILGSCLPVAFRHESNRVETEELAAAEAARAAAAGGTDGPAAAPTFAAVPVYATSRYDVLPEVPAGTPAGLPDFREARPQSPAAVATLPAATAALLAAPEPGSGAGASPAFAAPVRMSPRVPEPAARAGAADEPPIRAVAGGSPIATNHSPAGGRVSVVPAEVPAVAGTPAAAAATAASISGATQPSAGMALPPRRHTAPDLTLGEGRGSAPSPLRASWTQAAPERTVLRSSQTAERDRSPQASGRQSRADEPLSAGSPRTTQGVGGPASRSPAPAGARASRTSVTESRGAAGEMRPAQGPSALHPGLPALPPLAPGAAAIRVPQTAPPPASPARASQVALPPGPATPASRPSPASSPSSPSPAPSPAPAPSPPPAPPSPGGSRPAAPGATRPIPAPPAVTAPDADPSPSQLADMFIDPYGTVGADEIEGAGDTDSSEAFVDTSSAAAEEPAAPRRAVRTPAPPPAPWMSSADMRSLERPAGTARAGRTTKLPPSS